MLSIQIKGRRVKGGQGYTLSSINSENSMSKHHIAKYAFKIPLMFEGDRGSGKTYDVREFAKNECLPYFEMAGHESIEAIDFLGHHVQSPHGIVWKDGRLSQAFRSASKGSRSALLIDEMLRIPQRHLSVLLSALAADSAGNYRLQTGRMLDVVDGIGVEEELVVPAKLLAVFATTNIGPEFAVDNLDPSVAERFVIVRKDTDKKILLEILTKHCELRNFSSLIALKLADFFDRTERMVQTSVLNRHATTRTLSRAIEHADDEDDVKNLLRDQALLWVDRNASGRPEPSQLADVYKAIDQLFPSSAPLHEFKAQSNAHAHAVRKTRAATSTTSSSSAPASPAVDDEADLFGDAPWAIEASPPALHAIPSLASERDPRAAPARHRPTPADHHLETLFDHPAFDEGPLSPARRAVPKGGF